VYDFVEFISQNGKSYKHADFEREVNRVLERDVSAYRLIDKHIARITNPTEVEAIEDARQITAELSLAGATAHLDAALMMLSDRTSPDYRNSIKESISAVESVAKQIAGDTSADLGRAIMALERKTPLHGALKAGFLSLYGFTSDSSGIRHALMDSPTVDFTDAKYMLVTCSAFVSFLATRARESGIPL
jgi:hypothetical protein